MGRDPMRIDSERLRIRSLEISDLESLKAIRRDRLVYRHEPAFLQELQGTSEEALAAIRGMELETSRQCILGVYEKADAPVFVGLAEFYDYKPSGKVISVGYRFLHEYWGRGIATGCIQAMIGYVKSRTKVEMITAHVLPENGASARCLIKNGFEYLLTKDEDWGYGHLSRADVYTFDC